MAYATVKPLALTSDVAVSKATEVALKGLTLSKLDAALKVNILTLPVVAAPPPTAAPAAQLRSVLVLVTAMSPAVALIVVTADELPLRFMVPPVAGESVKVKAPVIVPNRLTLEPDCWPRVALAVSVMGPERLPVSMRIAPHTSPPVPAMESGLARVPPYK